MAEMAAKVKRNEGRCMVVVDSPQVELFVERVEVELLIGSKWGEEFWRSPHDVSVNVGS